jgi:hypothetical protein
MFAAFKSADPDEVGRADRQFYAVQRWPTSADNVLIVAHIEGQPLNW